MLVDQVLVDGHGVAPQSQLRLDEAAMRLARRDRCRRAPASEPVAGVGEFAPPRPVATPGEFAAAAGEALLVGADRLAVDAGDALDLALAGAGVQQGPDGRLQVRLQDVHSVAPLLAEGAKVTSCLGSGCRQRPASPTPSRLDGRGGGIYVSISGGVWVSFGAARAAAGATGARCGVGATGCSSAASTSPSSCAAVCPSLAASPTSKSFWRHVIDERVAAAGDGLARSRPRRPVMRLPLIQRARAWSPPGRGTHTLCPLAGRRGSRLSSAPPQPLE